MSVTVRMAAISTVHHTHELVHDEEHCKSYKDANTNDNISLLIEFHKVHLVVEHLAHERLWKQVQKHVSKQTANREGHKRVQRRGLRDRRHKKQYEVRH
jgi:hypothetical protein